MSERPLIPSFLLGLALVAASVWLLGSWQRPVGAAYPAPPTPTPTPAPRYVALSGTDAGNDCSARTAPCRTLQHAVDVAWGGTLIRVAQGTYSDLRQREGITQVVYLDKWLTLQGGYTTTNHFAGPPDPEAHPTILDAQGEGRVIAVESAGPTIEGFTITGGAGYRSGGGIWAHLPWGLTLRHNRIVGNSAEGSGGAAFIYGGSARIVDNLIADNDATWGAGLTIIDDVDVAVVGNEIRNNVARLRVGGVDVQCCGRTTALIAQNVIVENDGGDGGGGIRVMSTQARVVNNVVARNEAERGAGVFLEASASYPLSVTLVHNTLVGRGDGDEGVHAAPHSVATLVNNIVTSYTVGITNAAPASATVTADHTLFHANGADHGPDVSSTHEVIGSPAFLSPGTGDYHVTGASAALGAGVDAGVKVDIDGDLRLGVPDVGADEYWAPGALKRVYLPLVLNRAGAAATRQVSAKGRTSRTGIAGDAGTIAVSSSTDGITCGAGARVLDL